MWRPYQILLPLAALLFVRVDLTDLVPLKYQVKVLKVYDGDTVLVARGTQKYKVRLSKIDAPEKDQPYLSGRKGAGLLSTTCLKKLLKQSRSIELQIEKQDIYGRYLGDINQMSLKLIREGCAVLYPYTEFTSVQEKFLYLKALKHAQTEKKGLWQFGGIRQPRKWRASKKQIARQRWHQ